jgi:hypothetical protein
MKPEYPIEFVHTGSTNTILNVSDLVNGNYTTFSGSGSTGFSATSDGSGTDYCGTPDEIPFVLGKKFLIKFTHTLNSGYVSNVSIRENFTGGSIMSETQVNCVSGVNTIIFTCTSSTTGVVRWANPSSVTDYTVSNLLVMRLGCLLNLNVEGIGYATNIWQDRLNSLSATVAGATVQVPAMSELGAVKCNGSSSFIAYSSMPNGLAGNMSMSGWINPLYIGGNGQIFSNGKVILYTNSAGYLSFTRNGSTYLNSSASSITVNNWYHFVITSDNAGATKIYINGVLSSSGAAGTPSAATTYYVGRATTAANYFNGAIDDLRFYNRELLPEEITLMYNER